MPESLASVLASVPPHEMEGVIYSGKLHEIHLDGCKRCLVEKVLKAESDRLRGYGMKIGEAYADELEREARDAGLDFTLPPSKL